MNNIDFSKIEIFKGKTYDDLLKEIHTNSVTTRVKINKFIDDLGKLVTNPDDANLLVPLITDYLGAIVKNDEQLIKLAGIIQRFLKNSSNENSETSNGLSVKEREELFAEVGKVVEMGK